MQKKCTASRIAYCLSILALSLSPWLASAQTMKLTPTFESIGIELPLSSVNDQSACRVKFKAAGGEWQNGLDLFVDRYTDKKGFRGSIVLLEPNTEYEVELCYGTKSGSCKTIKDKVRTWKEEFIGTKVSVSNREDLKSKLRSGSASGGYRILDGNNQAVIDAGSKDENAIRIEGLSYVVLRNMKIKGGKRSAVYIKNSHHIVVENCDISQWGANETYCGSDYKPANGKRFIENGKLGGVHVYSSSQVVVQRNKIHDPIANSCNWSSVPEELQKRKKDPVSSHPAGPRGITLVEGVRQSVFRYNHVYADYEKRDTHYFSDIFNGEERGTESDIDVYGNDFGNAWDDGIEIEGLNKNIRVWNNAIHHVYQGVASDRNSSTYYGPLYVWRNIITDLSKSPRDTNGQLAGFKLDNGVGKGGIYLFSNTISGLGNANKNPYQGITNNNQYNFVVKNNIFEVSDKTFRNNGGLKPNSGDLNYNAYSEKKEDIFGRSDWNRNWEARGQFSVRFTYQKDDKKWNYRAQDNGASKAQGKGVRIPNFIDPSGEQIDLGAAQKGVWNICVGPQADRNCSRGTNPPTPPAQPLPEPSIAAIEAAYVPANLLISGYSDGSYWATAPTYQFAHPDSQASNNQVTLKTLWTEQELLVGVTVKDSKAVVNSADADKPWNNDGIELLLDIKNNNAAAWDTTQGHRQVVVDFEGNQHVEPAGWPVTVVRGPTDEAHPGHHYVIRVPWTSLKVKPEDRPEIGIDVANNDREANQPKTQFTYTGRTDTFKVPGRFAKLKLGKQAPLQATPASSPITLDGKLDEAAWQQATAYPFGPSFLSQAVARLLWTPDSLYVSWKVTETSLVAQADPLAPWRNDGVELLLDIKNNNADGWNTAQGHKQLVVDAQGNLYRDPSTLTAAVGKMINESKFVSGYVVEVGIPWNSLGVENPQARDLLGIELVRNDRSTDGTIKSTTITGRSNDPGVSFKRPSAFADLLLVGDANARTALAGKSATGPLSSEARALVVYPNPSPDGTAQLRLSGFADEALVQIVNTKGQVVYQGAHYEAAIQLSSRFPRGLYVVRVSDAKGTLTEKLLIE